MLCVQCPSTEPSRAQISGLAGMVGGWGRVASDLNSAEQTGVGLTAALGERELKLPAPFGEAPSQPPVFILGGTDERLRVTLGPARLSPWVGAWEAGLGRLAGQSRPFVLSPFSVEHLFTREPWALGVGPGLGTRESDNSQACHWSLRDWTLGRALLK